jgi:plasmid stability protein
MKTSLIIPDTVYRAVKRRAAATHRTIGELVDEALRNWLAKEAAPPPYRLQWPVEKDRAPPNANVNDREDLYDAMEDRR